MNINIHDVYEYTPMLPKCPVYQADRNFNFRNHCNYYQKLFSLLVSEYVPFGSFVL